MATIQEVATLDARTVQRVASGLASGGITGAHPRKRHLSVVQPTFASPVVDQRVWVTVKKIVASPRNSYTRWEILDETTMVIR